MRIKKDVGVIIKFDDKEYSKEETIFYYQRFFEILAEVQGVKILKNTGKIIYEGIIEENDTHKETRASEN